MQVLNSNHDPVSASLNGEQASLAVDRALGELRRGRAIAITSPEGALVIAAVETMSSGLLRRMIDANGGTQLVLTAERARASGLAARSGGPMALTVAGHAELDELRALAGMAGDAAAVRLAAWSGPEAPVLAAFGLAKAARLIPALVAFQTKSLTDPSLHRVGLAAILEYAGGARNGMQLISESRVPLEGSEASRVALFRDEYGGGEHVAVIIGEPDLSVGVPVRLHSACLTGDLLGSLRCDCGEQLTSAVARIAGLGGGVLLYLDQEGRNIGLANKLRAYSIQDTGLDTFDADHHLGFSSDERSYDVAAAMLQQLGISRVRLLTNNPHKIDALREHGIEVEDRIPLVTAPNEHNAGYLKAKRERAGHLSDDGTS